MKKYGLKNHEHDYELNFDNRDTLCWTGATFYGGS